MPPAGNGPGPNGEASTVTELRRQAARPTRRDQPDGRRRARTRRPPTSRPRATAAAAYPEPPVDTTPADDDASGPNVLPDYMEMTIPQLRARLRKLSEPDLRALLAWETAHDNRPPFVTMLTNRITTVTEA